MKIYLPQQRFKNYVNALQLCGAEAAFYAPEECDALLLPGGADIDPAYYGQENAGSEGIDLERDRAEFEVFDLFKSLKKPILGICRGEQLINVALGGTLHQDIAGHRTGGEEDVLHGSHTTDKMLISLYGESFTINSSHHQVIDRLGEGLLAVQWSEDGFIEAVRHESLPIFGVQWHPERLREPTDGHRLIKAWLDSIKD